MLPFTLPPAARAFTTAGSFCIARACSGSSVARLPRSLMHPLERLNLGRERSGRLAIAAVFFMQRRVDGPNLLHFRPSAPFGPETHQDWQHKHGRDGGEHRTQTDRDATNDATRSVSD